MTLNELINKANEGDPQSIYDLAASYEYGDEELEIDVDYEKAHEYYEKLSELGYKEGNEGCFRYFFRQGHMSKCAAKFFELREKLVGDTEGDKLYNAAIDELENKNYEKMFNLLKSAAFDFEHPMSIYKFALMCGCDEIVKYNFNHEMELLEKAAEKGLAEAMFRLALNYEQSDDGTIIDIDLAIKWYEKAIEAGYTNAKGNLKKALKKKEQMQDEE